MSQSEQKIVQYLNEAHASEVALVSVLHSQIAMSTPGSYREGLEKHAGETREHARRLRERLEELEHGGNPFQALVGFGEAVIGEMVALSKAPFDLWRGGSGAEKVLKDAKDACAAEALEIATYAALEQLADHVGDAQTARLASSIRRDEERMLQRILREIPKLTDAVAGAEIDAVAGEGIGDGPSHEITDHARTGAEREVGRQSSRPARGSKTTRASRTTRASSQARAGRTPHAGESARADETAHTDTGARADGTARSGRTGRAGQATRQTQPRAGSRARQAPEAPRPRQVEARANGAAEPWPGYDGLTVAEIEAVLNEGDLQRAQAVAAYERAHKNRPEVMRSALVPARFLLSSTTR